MFGWPAAAGRYVGVVEKKKIISFPPRFLRPTYLGEKLFVLRIRDRGACGGDDRDQ